MIARRFAIDILAELHPIGEVKAVHSNVTSVASIAIVQRSTDGNTFRISLSIVLILDTLDPL